MKTEESLHKISENVLRCVIESEAWRSLQINKCWQTQVRKKDGPSYQRAG